MDLFAQTYTYTTTTSSSSMGVIWLLYLVFFIIYVVGLWKVFQKAGEAGWKSIIPIWNTIVELRIVGYSPWYILLFLIPFVNIIFAIIVAYRLAKSFGYGVGMTILEFVAGIGILIIGFGSSKYLGPNGNKTSKVEAE